jgi:UDP-N-acetylglucosamine diphosphorylase / glucose-1-phosphate thymidylyltransferase / UDP-N-acetylgalactosamine diphosphorylase / glucosamine-1-phosphate N-acetyltransferase / galactosamine-1-phosphate N-acetyltransferase
MGIKMAIDINCYINAFQASLFKDYYKLYPWEITDKLCDILEDILGQLKEGYSIQNGVAIHESARVEQGSLIKGPAIIGPSCFIASGVYLRDGAFLEGNNILGPGTEIKSSCLFKSTKLAHFNFVGDSILGESVNLEAGSVIANFRNELKDPKIVINLDDKTYHPNVLKFGALVGDFSKIGANAVLAPGTILKATTIVPRLGLVDQS